jgi:hypothetical protein
MVTNHLPVEVVPPELVQEIGQGIHKLLTKQAQLKAEIATLEEAGCISGYIIPEFRNHNGERLGPYYRLHFYSDIPTGQKKPPQYIGADEAKVAAIKQQIINQVQCQALKNNLAEVEQALFHIGKSFSQLNGYIEMRLSHFKQISLFETTKP